MREINLNELIIDTFTDVIGEIINCEVNRAVLNGGRASTKSQNAATAILVGCTVYKESAVALIRYNNKVEERLVNTFRESIRYLGIEDSWKLRKSPFEYVLLDDNGKETDVSIKFTGCDNPENLKSFKPRRGNFRYIWFEELDNFKTYKDVRSLMQTFARGTDQCVIMTYNPPMRASSWVNEEYTNNLKNIVKTCKNRVYQEFDFEIEGKSERIRQVIHKSTYLDVIHGTTLVDSNGKKERVSRYNWLGIGWIGDAEQDKIENEKYYRWAYLGEVVGTDANVFNNLREWDGNTDDLELDIIKRGFDWGYGGPDPDAYIEWYYDRRNRKIYALNEFGGRNMEIDDIAYNIKQFNKHNFTVTSDRMPKLNNMLRARDINIVPAKKAPESKMAGIKWLRSLRGIYISKERTPMAYKEFMTYEYEVDKNDEVTSKIPDGNDHWIDASRYAFEDEFRY